MKSVSDIVWEFLNEKGIDVNKKDKDGRNALNFATENGHKEIVEFLMKYETKKQEKYYDIDKFFELFNIVSQLFSTEISFFLF